MSKPLYTSASAIESADPKNEGCYRKWYFAKRMKLPEVRKGSTVFGDVIHAVAERYLEADEHGMVDGKPVELYPEDWDKPINKWTKLPDPDGVSLEEQALIKDLIARSIEEGVLMRVEGRKVEEPIRSWPVMDGVLVNGFIDLLEPGAIRDHKSTKAMKWAKSVKKKTNGSYPKNALALNVQINLYAYWYYTKGGWDKELPLTISHQYFVKNPDKPHVEKREDTITWEQVETFFKERIQPVIEMMLVYRDAEKYSDIPLPLNPQSACSKFGGCPYATICTDQETCSQYKKRIDKEISGKNTTNYKQVADDLKGDTDMSTETPMQKKIREIREKRAGGATKTEAKEEVVKEEVAAPAVKKEVKKEAPVATETASSSPQQTAPWYKEGCGSCKDNDIQGINSAGTGPCKICDVLNKKAGNKTSADFIWMVEEGKLEVYDSDTGEAVVSVSTNEPVTAKEEIADPTVEAATKEEAHAKIAEAQAEDEAQTAIGIDLLKKAQHHKLGEAKEEEAAEEVEAFGRPEDYQVRDKFVLIIGAAVTESKVRGGGKFGSPSCRMSAEELLLTVEAKLSEVCTPSRWLKMDTFKRRDAVRLYAEQIAEMVGASTVVAAFVPRGTVMEAMISAIRPYAGMVIQGLSF